MALATADIHVKIDPIIKKRAERKLRDAGLTISDFVNIELRKVIRGKPVTTDINDGASPRNLSISSEAELISLLKERLEREEKSSHYYTLEQAREKLAKEVL